MMLHTPYTFYEADFAIKFKENCQKIRLPRYIVFIKKK
jgi:hypothetical protein